MSNDTKERSSIDDISVTTSSDKLHYITEIPRFEHVDVDFYPIITGHVNASRAPKLDDFDHFA